LRIQFGGEQHGEEHRQQGGSRQIVASSTAKSVREIFWLKPGLAEYGTGQRLEEDIDGHG
jgi:hypothetical protein